MSVINEEKNIYGALTVISRAENYIAPGNGRHAAMWNCVCQCGNTTTVRGTHLRNGTVKSCGCSRSIEVGESNVGNLSPRTSEYNHRESARNIMERCGKDKGYEHIECRIGNIIEEVETFLLSLPGYMQGYTIDRIDVNGHYEDGNLRWASDVIQNHNRGMFSNNTSGVKGVSYDKQRKSWKSKMEYNRVRYEKRFKTFEEAVEQRRLWEIEFLGHSDL